MPKFNLFAVTTLFYRPSHQRATAAEAHTRMTRSRAATRRLRAYGAHEPYSNLSPLDLTRRH